MEFRTAFEQSDPVTSASFGLDRFRIPLWVVVLATAVLDAALIVAGSLLARALFRAVSGRGGGLLTAVELGSVAAILFVATAQAMRLYDLPTLLAPNALRTLGASVIVALLLTANLFVFKVGADVSRGFVLVFAAIFGPACLGLRLRLARILADLVEANVVGGQRAVLIGSATELNLMPPRHLFRQYGFSETGRVTLAQSQAAPEAMLDRAAAEAVRLARVSAARTIVVALPWDQTWQLARLEEGLLRSPLPVHLLPDAGIRAIAARHPVNPAQGPILLRRAPVRWLGRVAKRILDIVIAGIALVVLLPLMVATALAIRLDSPGPVIFRQLRVGFDQGAFTILKFRTMAMHDESDTVAQARREDSRVTRVGRFLRRASLDELPQLLNVLRGDMAIVGPRPHALPHDDLYGREIDAYCARHHVKPGITGWAQVNGLRGETSEAGLMRKRVEHDLWYIDNWSLALDLRILLRTCFEVLAHDAY